MNGVVGNWEEDCDFYELWACGDDVFGDYAGL